MKLKVLVIFILLCTMNGLVVDSSSSAKEIPLNKKLNVTSHDPISINGDTQLNQTVQSEGWLGSGVEKDPYVIENYFISLRTTIDTYFEASIGLMNIQQHLVIKNNLLSCSDKYWDNGIYIIGCSNITIVNNEINDYGHGITIRNSQDIIIQTNLLTENNAGSDIISSNNVKYEKNTLLNSSSSSFYFQSCENLIFRSNVINFSNILDWDPAFSNPNKIYDTSSLVFYNNTFFYSHMRGCSLEEITDSQITYNKFVYSQSWDLDLFTCSSNNITRNQFINEDIDNYNLYMWGSNNNIIYENNFISNSNTASHIQTDTIGNLFYNNERGNYYSKYTGVDNNSDGIGDTPFLIVTDEYDDFPLIDPVDFEKPIISDHDTELTYSVDDDLIISWTANDENPTDYKVYEGGSLVTSGTWVNGSNVADLGNLSAGTYELVVSLLDKDGNHASFTVTVIINEITSSTSSSTSATSNETDPLGEIGDLISDNIVVIAAVSGVGLVSIFILRRLFGGKKKPKKK